MKKDFLVCEFCDPNSTNRLTLISSEFDHCSVCGICRDNCQTFAADVEFVKDEGFNQHTCLPTCSHRTCGNYTVSTYTRNRKLIPETQFWFLVNQLPTEHYTWVKEEIARIRVYDYDLENADFHKILNDALNLFGEV